MDLEEANPRNVFAAAKFLPSADLVWRRTARAERYLRGHAPATLLWDLYECLELVNLDTLRARCQQSGLNPVMSLRV